MQRQQFQQGQHDGQPPASTTPLQAGPEFHPAPGPGITRTERDIVALGIILAAIILFVGTGSSVLTRLVRHLVYGEASVDALLTNALLLNIALIIFGWRRYTDLTREVAARREAELAALRLADTDPLTGLLNRRSFDTALKRMALSAQQSHGSLIVLLIDLDRFKRANDVHGHQVGDIVLIEVARRVGAILPADSTVARLGGDEFAALVAVPNGTDSTQQAERFAKELGGAIAQPILCNHHTVIISASIGLARHASAATLTIGDTINALMYQADMAMYQAKKAGRNQFCWFDPVVERDMAARHRLEHAIRNGLQNDEFRPSYDKQIDLASGVLIGLEMLARWDSPEYGTVGPDVFAPIAEEIGLLPALSETLIRKALTDARDWAPHLTLAINIAPAELRDPRFAQRLLKLLVDAGVPPHRLDIEITELCLIENLPMVRSLVTSLRNQGIRISLDKFGQSATSLSHLRTLPFDQIKIDRTFVAGLGQNNECTALVEAISSLGRGMALPLTAEGIESEAVAAELQKLGNFRGQGRIYGQPMSAEALRTELAGHNLLMMDTPAALESQDARTG